MSKREERVLAYVNRLRSELGLKPLKRLPKGTPNSCDRCVVAKALGGGGREPHVDMGSIYVNERNCKVALEVTPPNYVADFIHDFDCGKFPHLEASR